MGSTLLKCAHASNSIHGKKLQAERFFQFFNLAVVFWYVELRVAWCKITFRDSPLDGSVMLLPVPEFPGKTAMATCRDAWINCIGTHTITSLSGSHLLQRFIQELFRRQDLRVLVETRFCTKIDRASQPKAAHKKDGGKKDLLPAWLILPNVAHSATLAERLVKH